MRVASRSPDLIPSASQIPTLQAKPEILRQLTLSAVTQLLLIQLTRWVLLKAQRVLTGRGFQIPGLDLFFSTERQGVHHILDHLINLSTLSLNKIDLVGIAFDRLGDLVPIFIRLGCDRQLRNLLRRSISIPRSSLAFDVQGNRMIRRFEVEPGMSPVSCTASIEASQADVQSCGIIL